MGIIDEHKQKTIFIKSFVPIKYLLEKGRVEKKPEGLFIRKSEFAELIEHFRADLYRRLTNEDVDKLKKLSITTPANGIILLLPYLKYPLVGFNLERVLSLFKFPCWLFHATTDEGLRSCSQSGFLLSPIEMILEKKSYLSSRFEKDANIKRIEFGISFAFQDSRKYQAYGRQRGGFFIFPVNSHQSETWWHLAGELA